MVMKSRGRGFKSKPLPGSVRTVQAIGANIRSTIVNKAGRLVECESFAERTLLLRLERDARVRDYMSQPETLIWIDADGATRHYTPDFIVWYWNGAIEMREVTRSERRDLEQALAGRTLTPEQRAAVRKMVTRTQAREREALRVYGTRGWGYIVDTQETLPRGTELANLIALYRYRPTCYADPHVSVVILDHLHGGERCTLDALVALAASACGRTIPEACAAVCYALWHGMLAVDLAERLLLRDGDIVPGVRVWLPASGGEVR